MPIYEYRCESCGEILEKIQKFNDPALTDCPQCEEPALVKLVSASSFRLKGSGWYETDFKTGSKKNGVGESSDGKGKSSTDKEASSSSEKNTASNEGKKNTSKKENVNKTKSNSNATGS